MFRSRDLAYLFCFLCAAISASPARAEPLRQDVIINRDWKFQLGDFPRAGATYFDDSKWQSIGLPHSFSIPYFKSKDFYTGYGWYRKHFWIPRELWYKRFFIEFAGAFQDAEVFVNGRRIGEHKGGYTGFSMEVTTALHGGENVMAVRVNNNWNPQIEPRAGDHNFNGGIYRDVHLVITDPLHVTWYGTFITTPHVSTDSGTVDIKTEVINQALVSATCVVTTDILDPDGKPVAHVASTQPLTAGTTVTFDQTTTAIPKPKLWSPPHPFLYTAVTTVSDGTRKSDDYRTTFGFRWFKWTADQGFFLNGEHYYFHGANVHQDHAGWADATTQYGSWRDVKLVKEAGLDFIRGSHYPHHPAFADACDKLGVLFWSENCFWGVGGPKQEGGWKADAYPPNAADQAPFEQNALDTLRDEIRIFRNHPSIVIWSMCNEVFFSGNQDKVKSLLTKLVNEAHQLDPTRPAAIGGCQRGDLDKLGDVAGYNGDGATLFMNPGVPNVVTEYGSDIEDRPGKYNGQFGRDLNEHTPEYPWRSGQALWCAFDYGTIFGHFGCMGFVDYFRIPKRSWYWYRNQYLHIPPPEWPRSGVPARIVLIADNPAIQGTDATDDAQIFVTVQDKDGKPLSNSPRVTLSIASGPGEFPTGRSITFNPPSNDPQSDIAICDGQAAIEFRSYYAGQTVLSASSPGLEEGTLTITTTGVPVFVPGQTPLAPDRPYIRFVRSDQSKSSAAGQNIALNHPASASSEAPGHTPGLAIDGNLATGWQPAGAQAGAWWQVDLEGLYSIQTVKTTLGAPGSFQYKLEASPDGSNWTLLSDQTQTTKSDPVRVDSCARNARNRFLRLTITGFQPNQTPTIEELEIQGTAAP